MKSASSRFEIGATDRSMFPKGGRPEVAFLGRSNVGKSSLINSLLGAPGLARVSRTPGRTQQAHFYLVQEAFYLVDLPGYGYARAPRAVRERFADLIEEYLVERRELRLAIHLVDARHEPLEADRTMAAWLGARKIPALVVLTKVDKIPRGERRKSAETAVARLGASELILHSSKTGEGRKELWQIITQATARDRSGT